MQLAQAWRSRPVFFRRGRSLHNRIGYPFREPRTGVMIEASPPVPRSDLFSGATIMGSVEVASAPGGEPPVSSPWPALTTGLTAAVLAIVWRLAFSDAATPVPLILLVV